METRHSTLHNAALCADNLQAVTQRVREIVEGPSSEEGSDNEEFPLIDQTQKQDAIPEPQLIELPRTIRTAYRCV